MWSDLGSALCLVMVLEGLFLFAAPDAWKRAAAQLIEQPSGMLRRLGGIFIVVGLLSLFWVRSV
ncbi:MAG: hypothetical protein BWZ07_02526 [Alphaproteobacteria bacterium ADurb.BinA280]|jgi:uncharacterized protein|nr:DUF2065 domain-containing protein [Xanthomonadales bacterium]MCC6504624.1 DUF2065 domain-containing protein [Aquimonas sp.]OPZ10644.1 MAG: hypothetical protein BWZ07_02526 [Alphaproteobacteria bacterium ADurb.BinA280]